MAFSNLLGICKSRFVEKLFKSQESIIRLTRRRLQEYFSSTKNSTLVSLLKWIFPYSLLKM
eukprot:UN03971